MSYYLIYISWVIGSIIGRCIAIKQNGKEFFVELKNQLTEPVTWVVTFILPTGLILLIKFLLWLF